VEVVRAFRQRLWAHDLGADIADVAKWKVPDFFTKWDTVAKHNDAEKNSPSKLMGEGIIPFDPRTVQGKRSRLVPDIAC
jgi:hypothetical protein